MKFDEQEEIAQLLQIGLAIGFGRAQQILGQHWDREFGCAPRGSMGVTKPLFNVVYKASDCQGNTCHFGVESAARAWAKGGKVEVVRLRNLRVAWAEQPAAEQKPVAWMTRRTKNGKKRLLDLPECTANPHYVEVYSDWLWEPLYAAPQPTAPEVKP